MQTVFKALSDPTRREILRQLSRGSMTAGELSDLFPTSRASLSHHFNVLKSADLVRTERRGQSIVYSLNTSVVEEIVEQRRADALLVAVTLTVAGISATALLAASGRDVPLPSVVTPLIGALFVVLGNYLGKVRRNFFIGIRTPWTLASEEVWARTHRVGGWLFVLAGLAMLVSVALRLPPFAMLASTVGATSLITVGYSYVVYRRLHGTGGEASDG